MVWTYNPFNDCPINEHLGVSSLFATVNSDATNTFTPTVLDRV